MKAVMATRYGGSDVLQYCEVDKPEPRNGQLLVKVMATAVGFGDTLIRAGAYMGGPKSHSPSLPAILGFQASGIVEGVGEEADKNWLGRRVIVNASHANAEYLVCSVGSAAEMPLAVGFDVATLLPNFYLTAYHLLETAVTAETGRTAVVWGAAGGVGTALVQLGKLAGLKIIAIAGTDEKCAFAGTQGADHVINHAREKVPERVKDLTHGVGADLVFNPIVGETLLDDLRMLAPFGRTVVYGLIQGPPKPDIVNTLMFEAVTKSLSIGMFSLWTIMEHDPERIRQSLHELLALLEGDKIAPQIYAKLPLSDLARAHDLLESRKVTGNVVIEI
jgi:NADPH2:quinone reductase